MDDLDQRLEDIGNDMRRRHADEIARIARNVETARRRILPPLFLVEILAVVWLAVMLLGLAQSVGWR